MKKTLITLAVSSAILAIAARASTSQFGNLIDVQSLLPLLSPRANAIPCFLAGLVAFAVIFGASNLWSLLPKDDNLRSNFTWWGVALGLSMAVTLLLSHDMALRRARLLADVLNSRYSIEVSGDIADASLFVALKATPQVDVFGAKYNQGPISVLLDYEEALAISRFIEPAHRPADRALLSALQRNPPTPKS